MVRFLSDLRVIFVEKAGSAESWGTCVGTLDKRVEGAVICGCGVEIAEIPKFFAPLRRSTALSL